MISLVRNRLGIPGLIAIIAMVFAMGGAAYAAKKYVITSTGQIKPSVLKKLKGKRGPQGPAGTNGTNGKDGASGTNGVNGKGIVTSALEPGEEGCLEGGVLVEVEGSGSPEPICNGLEGAEFPGGGVLPSGATERGTWAGDGDSRLEYSENEGVLEHTESSTFTFIPISFPLPVQPAPEAVFSKQLEEEAEQGEPVAPVAGCPGLDGEGLPMAEPGKLCVYQMSATPQAAAFFFAGTKPFPQQGADSMGTVAGFTCTSHNCHWFGVWAVTAP